MTRDTYKTVTVPIVIYCAHQERDGSASFLSDFQGLRPVRILRDKDLSPESRFWQSIGAKQREEFLAAVQLLQAVGSKDALEAKNALVRIEGSHSVELERIALSLVEKVKGYPQTRLDELISLRLEPARLVVWNYQNRPTLAVFCPNNLGALFAKLLLNRVSGVGLAVCPKCGVLFVRRRPNQNYCSIQHREAHRVARSRARKADKSKKKGGK